MSAKSPGAIRLFSMLALSAAIFLASNAFAIDPLQFRDAAEEARFKALSEELRCLVCQNQNLADSDAGLAKDLRAEVFAMLRAGKSDAEIKEFLVTRYSDFVLYRPQLKTSTWLLWFGPGLVLLIGAAVVVGIVRKRAKLAPSAPTPHSEEEW